MNETAASILDRAIEANRRGAANYRDAKPIRPIEEVLWA